jgi:hypothetical protein
MNENGKFAAEVGEDDFQVEVISDDRPLLDHYIIAN